MKRLGTQENPCRNNYEIDNDNITKVHGITIINGTQLTGTIGVVERLKEDFLVPI